ncbi:AraC family transcriptional regulator [Aeromicrobium flavum]|uniref:AraC family transcriptional regulator n=1 Tax=Aeromicrobium flavum TaxID=416568 RepID=A0A512HXY0_9ACTN|nr:helix-turn-helix domain-containing protein [Aeromicrobium flavum]GEO90318.1 AraC family transcriptional regulator [Aeromicrobium flavum]
MTKVAMIVSDHAEPFGMGVLAEVWAEPHHPGDDSPVFDFVVCTPVPGVVSGASGFDFVIRHGLEAAADADLVAVAAKRDYRAEDPRVSEALRAAHERGATIMASCTAAFQLGHAGLLDGRRCTTHWRYGDELADRFPLAEVDTDVLYVDDDRIVTGAGSAAGIDANLHLMRQWFGARVAATAARRIVVPPHRDGGQAQFVRTPMAAVEAETLSPVLDWAEEHLAEPLTVAVLARRAHLSERTFARRFRDETGTTPWQWLLGRRVALAEELLETTELSVEHVAGRVGFGNAATLRHHFSAVRGTSPQAYRRSFSRVESA